MDLKIFHISYQQKLGMILQNKVLQKLEYVVINWQEVKLLSQFDILEQKTYLEGFSYFLNQKIALKIRYLCFW